MEQQDEKRIRARRRRSMQYLFSLRPNPTTKHTHLMGAQQKKPLFILFSRIFYFELEKYGKVELALIHRVERKKERKLLYAGRGKKERKANIERPLTKNGIAFRCC